MDITPYIGTIVTVVISVGAVYAAITSRLTRLETMIVELSKKTDKHNNVIERTFTLEADLKTAFRNIDEIKERLDRIERR